MPEPWIREALRSAALSVAQAADVLNATLIIADPDFAFGESLIADVTYENTGGAAVNVMNRVVLDGYPLHFDIVNVDTGIRVRLAGPEVDLVLTDADFTLLLPGESLTGRVNLLRDSANGDTAYALTDAGAYEVTAVYEQIQGVARSVSNTVPLQVSGTQSRSIALVADWNLVGWTGATPVVDATASIAGDFRQHFPLGCDRPDVRQLPAAGPLFLNTLTELTFGDAFWMFVSNSAGTTWMQPASSGAREVSVPTGVSLRLWTGPDGTPMEQAVASIAGMLESAFLWDAGAQQFESYRPNLPPAFNTVETIDFGDGVWMFTTAAGI